jgi:hypothetical protein
MSIVTANDIRALAHSSEGEQVLALVDDVVVILPLADVGDGQVIITREALLRDVGLEVSDYEAELVAGRLTADLSPEASGPGTVS